MDVAFPPFLEDLNWIAVDTETSGTNPWKYEIIEIGAVRFSIDKEIDHFQILIKPEKKQDPKARTIHNISEEELDEKGVTSLEAMEKFLAFIGDDPLVFHNAPFDIAFFKITANLHNLKLPNNIYYDTLFLSRTYLPDMASYALDSLRKVLKIQSGPAHRALSDAVATASVFSHILKTHAEKFASRRRLKTFLRYHRKFSAFEVKVPEDFDRINSYFQRFVQTNSFIKVTYYDKNNRKLTKTVFPLEILVFNQILYLKTKSMGEEEPALIKIQGSIFYDPDLGPLTF